jgi:hypothetical protein
MFAPFRSWMDSRRPAPNILGGMVENNHLEAHFSRLSLSA